MQLNGVLDLSPTLHAGRTGGLAEGIVDYLKSIKKSIRKKANNANIKLLHRHKRKVTLKSEIFFGISW